MVIKIKFRHEIKHEINFFDMLALEARLTAVAYADENGIDGRYDIRSLYFDDAKDTALLEKLNGVNMREKFRIRYYNGDTSYIRLEKKSKINGLCAKSHAVLTRGEAEAVSAGDFGFMRSHNDPLVKELYTKIGIYRLAPKTIIDYSRKAFVFPAGNTRVTLDYNIRTGMRCIDFLNPDCVTVPVAGSPVILEVKWDDFLPDIIRDAVQLSGRHSTAYSKYAAGRVYG